MHILFTIPDNYTRWLRNERDRPTGETEGEMEKQDEKTPTFIHSLIHPHAYRIYRQSRF